jgi:ABC-type glycerol-3-phosphate transport system permease component
LNYHPTAAQDTWAQLAIAMSTLTFAPVKRAVPGVSLGVRTGGRISATPIELEEAAQVDGAGRPRALIYIVAPLALPGVIATSIFTFTLAWNDYIFTRILIVSDELKTLPVGVQDLFSAAVVDWGLVMAAGMLITIPALAFFMAVQRHLVAGWGTGGLKG